MQIPVTQRQVWCTSSDNDAAKSSFRDTVVLGEHLSACPQVHRHLLTLHGAAASTHGFVAARFVTTLVALAVLFGLAYWLL